MSRARTQKETLNSLRDEIANHGRKEVKETVNWNGTDERTIQAERVLIVLEMLYSKAIGDKGSISAGKEYLDRILGKPKENLSLDNAGSPFNSLSDSDLLSRVVDIINGARERGAKTGS